MLNSSYQKECAAFTYSIYLSIYATDTNRTKDTLCRMNMLHITFSNTSGSFETLINKTYNSSILYKKLQQQQNISN